ncbi:MAG: hypothetical protein IJX99_09490 [Clostridia bacterium]|nr:hypothetical protein [Clostridia bacterium]
MNIFNKISVWLTQNFKNRNYKKLPVAAGVGSIEKTGLKEIFFNNDEKNILKFTSVNSNEENIKKEVICKILKKCGCRKEIFTKVNKNFYECVDVSNLENIVFILEKFKFSKIELTKILTMCPEIILKSSDEIYNNISTITKSYEDINMVKHIILSYPPILLGNEIEYIKNTFNDFQISLSIQNYILLQNSNIFYISKEKLKNSLNIIKSLSSSNDVFNSAIISIPELIGEVDEIVIRDILFDIC